MYVNRGKICVYDMGVPSNRAHLIFSLDETKDSRIVEILIPT